MVCDFLQLCHDIFFKPYDNDDDDADYDDVLH